jgi:exopolyphosphatase/pppGpp-phosphohydrolase
LVDRIAARTAAGNARVISGEQEALLSFRCGVGSGPHLQGKGLVCDISAAVSTEFIFTEGNSISHRAQPVACSAVGG